MLFLMDYLPLLHNTYTLLTSWCLVMTLMCMLYSVLPHRGFFHRPCWFSICGGEWHRSRICPLTYPLRLLFQIRFFQDSSRKIPTQKDSQGRPSSQGLLEPQRSKDPDPKWIWHTCQVMYQRVQEPTQCSLEEHSSQEHPPELVLLAWQRLPL